MWMEAGVESRRNSSGWEGMEWARVPSVFLNFAAILLGQNNLFTPRKQGLFVHTALS